MMVYATVCATFFVALASAVPTVYPRGVVDLTKFSSWEQHQPVKPDYIKFVQLSYEWADVETVPGVYNFSPLDSQLQALVAEGRHAVVKLQSDLKPDWVYDLVPWTAKVWSKENWDNRTAMYWHPTYLKRHLALVVAFANHINNSASARQTVAYVRQSWCAIGEEGLGIPNDLSFLRNGSDPNWVVPSGCTESCDPPPSWHKNTTDHIYQSAVLKTYSRLYRSSKTLLLRTNTPDELVAPYLADIQAGFFGWFHTGAGMELTQCFNQTQRYANFRRDCLPGHTFCFAEMCGYGSREQPFTALEFAYWLCLSNMASGVSASGLHGATVLSQQYLSDPNFAVAYNFADDYMGLHARPDLSPGAWVAMKGTGDLPPLGDYNFLMKRVGRLEPGDGDGARQCYSDATTEALAVPYGAWCRILRPGKRFAFQLDTRLFGAGNKRKAAMVRVVFWSAKGSSFSVYYDDGTATGKRIISTTPADRWQVATANFTDALFARSGPEGSDLWVEAAAAATDGTAASVHMHMIEVRKIGG